MKALTGSRNRERRRPRSVSSASAGAANVKRQHMGKLQHNKTIVVDGPKVQAAVCGSTNHSWRGFFVQNNNAIILRGKSAVKLFTKAFDDYWAHDDAAGFGKTTSATWNALGLTGIDAQIGFSPRSAKNAVLKSIADDIGKNTTSSLFFLPCLSLPNPGCPAGGGEEAPEGRQDLLLWHFGSQRWRAPNQQSRTEKSFSFRPEALSKNLPQPFKAEPTGGGGTRLHHKFVVIDFDKPTARVYMGSYNFSTTADVKNGENLLVIRDRRIAVSYTIEALRIFDHYQFRVAQLDATKARKKLQLAKPPRKPGENTWWAEDYANARKIVDRELFA